MEMEELKNHIETPIKRYIYIGTCFQAIFCSFLSYSDFVNRLVAAEYTFNQIPQNSTVYLCLIFYFYFLVKHLFSDCELHVG